MSSREKLKAAVSAGRQRCVCGKKAVAVKDGAPVCLQPCGKKIERIRTHRENR